MAYTPPSVVRRGASDYIVTFTGTNIGGSTEVSIPGLPQKGRVLHLLASRVSGTGTTLDPILGTASGPVRTQIKLENGTPAADIDLMPEGGATYYDADGTLYYRGRPDSGSDNAEEVEIHIRAGWAD